jgi:hypothetical protein
MSFTGCWTACAPSTEHRRPHSTCLCRILKLFELHQLLTMYGAESPEEPSFLAYRNGSNVYLDAIQPGSFSYYFLSLSLLSAHNFIYWRKALIIL